MIDPNRWFWCEQCDCPAIKCEVCGNISCSGGGCPVCVEHDWKEVDQMFRDGTVPPKEGLPVHEKIPDRWWRGEDNGVETSKLP